MVGRLRQYLREAGRDPATFGIDGRLPLGTDGPAESVARAQAWQALGATHLAVNTMGIGLASPAAHIEAIRRFKEAIESSGVDFG
jgi:hypothetical protein